MPEIPKGAKTPQDHKTKSKKPKKPKRIFEFEYRGETYPINRDLHDDWEIAEAFSDNRIPEALRLMLGNRQYEQVKKNLTDKDGRLRGSVMSDFAQALFEELGELKN